jgi:hypothetical protein
MIQSATIRSAAIRNAAIRIAVECTPNRYTPRDICYSSVLPLNIHSLDRKQRTGCVRSRGQVRRTALTLREFRHENGVTNLRIWRQISLDIALVRNPSLFEAPQLYHRSYTRSYSLDLDYRRQKNRQGLDVTR